MRIGYISTWGQQCGISTYTEELAVALQAVPSIAPVDVTVFVPSEAGAGLREVPGIPWRSCWTRNCANLTDQLEPYVTGCDVLHFQHEDGLFHSSTGFLAALHAFGKKHKIVVTLHTVRHHGEWEFCGFYDDLLKLAHAVIVHTPECLASLANVRGRTAKLVHIPHGTPNPTGIIDEDARRKGVEMLHLPPVLAEKVLAREISFGLVQGFQGPNKNPLATIRGFAQAIATRAAPRAALVFSGETADQAWWGIIQGTIARTGYSARILYCPYFVPPEKMHCVMAATDWGVLNTTAWVLSSSGAAHLYATYGIPVAVANRPIYHEAMQGGAIPFDVRTDCAENPSLSLVNAIGALASSVEVREQVGKNMKTWAEATSWTKISARHAELYRSL